MLCVITAGPSAGKTSVIRELNARGYTVRPEAARIVIDQAVSEGRDVDELRSGPEFHAMVEDQDRRIRDNTDHTGEIVFKDRALADNIAYRRVHDRDVPDGLVRACEDYYDRVFMLERIDFEDDYARTENEEWAQAIHEELRYVYDELGHNIIDIPLMPVDKRADRIENHARFGPPVIH